MEPEQQPAARERKEMVDCMGCGDALDITGRKDGDRVSCPGCNAEFRVVDFGDGDLDIDFVT